MISAINLKAVTGTATVYHDGVKVSANVAVTGNVTSSSEISLTFAVSGDFNGGTIEGLFINPASIYKQAATTARTDSLNNTFRWNATTTGGVKMAIPGMNTSNFDVDNDDSYLFSSSTITADPRCDHEGVLISGNNKNIYEMTGEILTATTNCSISKSPNYIGMASVVAENGSGNGTEMWYATTNGTNSIFAILTR